MSTLTKYKKLKSAQAKKDRERRQMEKQANREFVEERQEIYKKFVSYIKPFNKKKIDGLNLSLEFNPRKRTIFLTIDKKFRYAFVVETNYESCHCSYCSDGGCAHEGTYTNDVEIYTISKKNKREHQSTFAWFLCKDDDGFVNTFDKFLEEFKKSRELTELIESLDE